MGRSIKDVMLVCNLETSNATVLALLVIDYLLNNVITNCLQKQAKSEKFIHFLLA